MVQRKLDKSESWIFASVVSIIGLVLYVVYRGLDIPIPHLDLWIAGWGVATLILVGGLIRSLRIG